MKIDIKIENNGVINTGNKIHSNFYQNEFNDIQLIEELNLLLNADLSQEERTLVQNLLKATKEKNRNKMIQQLKKFTKNLVDLIEKLSLTFITELVKKYWFS